MSNALRCALGTAPLLLRHFAELLHVVVAVDGEVGWNRDGLMLSGVRSFLNTACSVFPFCVYRCSLSAAKSISQPLPLTRTRSDCASGATSKAFTFVLVVDRCSILWASVEDVVLGPVASSGTYWRLASRCNCAQTVGVTQQARSAHTRMYCDVVKSTLILRYTWIALQP